MNKCCKHHMKRVKDTPAIHLIDTASAVSSTFYTKECQVCGNVDEMLDRRTIKKIGGKFILKKNECYIIQDKHGNTQNLRPSENHAFVIHTSEPKQGIEDAKIEEE